MLDPGLRSLLALAFAGLCAACSSDSPAGHEREGGSPHLDGGAVPHEDGGVDPPAVESGAPPNKEAGGAARDDAAVPERVTNVDFDSAKVVTSFGEPLLQDVVKPSQVSYFAFEGKAGTFYRLSTDSGAFAPDNFLSLHGPDRELIAENDDGPRWPGERVDSRLVVRLPDDGTYYVKVSAPTLDPAIFEGSFPLVYYHLTIDELLPGAEGISFEGEDVQFALDATSGYSVTTLLGAFDMAEGDAGGGVFRFTGGASQALIGQVLASGVHGNGSTAAFGLARVEASDGRVLAAIDRQRGQSAIHPPVDGEVYTLTMVPSGDLGSNAFYAVDLVMLPDNPKEQENLTNGALASAEAIGMTGATFRRGLILATMEDADVDYFRFDVAEGEGASVVCEGRSAGSGVHGLHAEVRNASGAIVASADETVTENLYIEPFAVATTGAHYLRLSSDPSPAPGVAPWARCLVSVQP